MIKISIDESSAFDILSIYQLKISNSETEEKRMLNESNFTDLYTELSRQLSTDLLTSILTSDEYKNLLAANLETFLVVDKAKTDEVLASEVDKKNYKRFICKKNLQVRFFKNDLSETKTGYEKYGNNKQI
jgi:hypothetical protein